MDDERVIDEEILKKVFSFKVKSRGMMKILKEFFSFNVKSGSID